jgi:hypothetical protein
MSEKITPLEVCALLFLFVLQTRHATKRPWCSSRSRRRSECRAIASEPPRSSHEVLTRLRIWPPRRRRRYRHDCMVQRERARCRILCGPRHPPLDVASQSFDCVIAIDVLKHLRPTDGLAWLKEVRRVAAPKAFVPRILRGRSRAACARLDLSPARVAKLVERFPAKLTKGRS